MSFANVEQEHVIQEKAEELALRTAMLTFANCIMAVISTSSKHGKSFSMKPCAANGRKELRPSPITPERVMIHTSETYSISRAFVMMPKNPKLMKALMKRS